MSINDKGTPVGHADAACRTAANWHAGKVAYPSVFAPGEQYATVSGHLTPPYPTSPTLPWTERKVRAWDRRCAEWLVAAVNTCPRPDLLPAGALDPGNLSAADVRDAEIRLFDDCA